MGTRIEGLQLLKVTDGDTVRVLLDDVDESLRLTCMDTEESRAGSGKPVTAAGKLATAFAKQLFGADDDGMVPEGAGVTVDIEFDSDDPQDEALVIHRDNYGRLLCYLHFGQTNYNLELVRLGYSPYFDKYGRAHAYHRDFVEAEAVAQADNLVIWNPETNHGGPDPRLRLLATLVVAAGAGGRRLSTAGRPGRGARRAAGLRARQAGGRRRRTGHRLLRPQGRRPQVDRRRGVDLRRLAAPQVQPLDSGHR
jgi:micrococcal nuclease